MTRVELDQWAAEDRIDTDCQILQEGWSQWKWAEEVLPQLARADQPPAESSPFAEIGPSAGPVTDGNAYASPQEATSNVSSRDATLSPIVIRCMKGTRPWVLFLSILAFICAGFTSIGLVVALMALIASPMLGIILFLLYGVFVGAYGCLGVLLLKYAKAMGALVRSRSAADFEKAIQAQYSFWKTFGIMVIAMMALMTVFYALALAGVMNAGPGAW